MLQIKHCKPVKHVQHVDDFYWSATCGYVGETYNVAEEYGDGVERFRRHGSLRPESPDHGHWQHTREEDIALSLFGDQTLIAQLYGLGERLKMKTEPLNPTKRDSTSLYSTRQRRRGS